MVELPAGLSVEDGSSLINVLSVPDGEEVGTLVELSGLELVGDSLIIVDCPDVCVAKELKIRMILNF
jgi:hypothetical protein